MEWTQPQFSRSQVDRAGRILAGFDLMLAGDIDPLEVLDNWRAAHNFPLNTFQMGLRRMSRAVDPGALVAQRLKRTPSVLRKLRRFPGMSLARMQDIGGCRAVVETRDHVVAVVDAYMRSAMKHRLVNHKDYIDTPKSSGYRGVHLVYRYRSDRRGTYNNLQIEVQIRSRIQHSWATAVETMGTFLSQSLKSSEGEEEWLRFFAATSSLFARKENSNAVRGWEDYASVRQYVKDQAKALSVAEKLTSYGEALKTIEQSSKSDAYYLMVLRPNTATLEIHGFSKNEFDEAAEGYLMAEKEVANEPGSEAVLVKTESLSALRYAYPNYFLDTQRFLQELQAVI